MASNSEPQKASSKHEEEFLKRFSLRKITVESEKPKDFPNTLNPKSDALKQDTLSQKQYHIEYKKLNSVVKAVGPWWMKSRGIQRNMSSEVLVTLVEDTGKKVYGSQFPMTEEVEKALSSYDKDKEASNNAAQQIELMFSARNFMDRKSVNDFFNSNGSLLSELRENSCIEKRVNRLFGLLNNLSYLRFKSGCEKCREQERQRNESEKYKGSLRTNASDISDIASNLNLCICALELIDEEMGDVSLCLQSMMGGEKCNYYCAVKRLQELRKPLREIIKNVQNQAKSSKKQQQHKLKRMNSNSSDESLSSTKKIEKPRSKFNKFFCVPKKQNSEEFEKSDQTSSKRSKKKCKKSDTHSEDDDSSSRRHKTSSKKGEKRSKKLSNKQKDLHEEDDDMCHHYSKSKKTKKHSEVSRLTNEKCDCQQDMDASCYKMDLRPEKENLRTIKSATNQRQLKKRDDLWSNRERYRYSDQCQCQDSEEEYYVTSKRVQTDFQNQPVYVPCFIYDQEPPNIEQCQDNAINICQDKKNRSTTRDCQPNDRNKKVNFVCKRKPSSSKGKSNPKYPPCCCDECCCRRNFKGGAEVIENDQDESMQKRRRKKTAERNCCCESSNLRKSSSFNKEIDENDVNRQPQKSISEDDMIETYRTTSHRKEVIERDEDNNFPTRKSVTVKKETIENYFYPVEERSLSNIETVGNQTKFDYDDSNTEVIESKQYLGNKPSLIDSRERKRSESRRSQSLGRNREDLNEQNFDKIEIETMADKASWRKKTEEEHFEEVRTKRNTLRPSQDMNGYESSNILENRKRIDERRSIRKTSRESKIDNEIQLNPSVKERSSRPENVEERKNYSKQRNGENMNADSYDSTRKSSLPKDDKKNKSSQVESVEINGLPSKRGTLGECCSKCKCLKVKKYMPEKCYNLDPTIKNKSNKTNIEEEKKSGSNKKKSEATYDGIDTIRNTLTQNADIDVDSVKTKSSRIEITELNRSPSNLKINIDESWTTRKSLKPKDDITVYEYDLDPAIKKRLSRSEIIKERKSVYNKRKSQATDDSRYSTFKSPISNSGMDEFEYETRSSRDGNSELNQSPSSFKINSDVSRSSRKSLKPNENIIDSQYDLDAKVKKRLSRSEITKERKSVYNKRKSQATDDISRYSTFKSPISNSGMDEFEYETRSSRDGNSEFNQSPSSFKINSDVSRSPRKSLKPKENIIDNEYDLDPMVKKRSNRTEIVEERKSLYNRKNGEEVNSNSRYSKRYDLPTDSDMDDYDTYEKVSSRVETVEGSGSQPYKSYSVVESSEEKRLSRIQRISEDDFNEYNVKLEDTARDQRGLVTKADKSRATESTENEKKNEDSKKKQTNQDNYETASDSKCQETQTMYITEDDDNGSWSITAIKKRGEIEAQLELKIQGVKCKVKQMESTKSANDKVETIDNNSCANCMPVITNDLAKEIRKIVGNRDRKTVFLKFSIVDDFYLIQMSTDNEYLGCLYASESAILEARNRNAFDEYITLSVTESWNTMAQIEKLIDHAFVVVKKDNVD